MRKSLKISLIAGLLLSTVFTYSQFGFASTNNAPSINPTTIASYPLALTYARYGGTDLLSGWDFTSGYTPLNATVNSATNFSVSADNGQITKSSMISAGVKYQTRAAGTVSSGNFVVRDSGGANLATLSGTFDSTFTFTGIGPNLTLRLSANGANVTITTLTMYRIGVMEDISGNGYNGTITPGASTGFTTDQRGIANRAYDFDGADTTIVTSLTSNTPFTSGFTISAWIRPDNVGETAGFIVDKSTDTTAGSGFRFILSSNNRILFSVNTGTGRASADNAITYGAWQHVLVTVASNTFTTFYVNGVLNGTPGTVSALSNITTTNPLTIGNRSTATDRTFDGGISDVRIFNYVLSQAQITQLYQTSGRNYKNVSGAGSVITNVSGL